MKIFPDSVEVYSDYIKSIDKYNKWFINLRFYAVMLTGVFLVLLRWLIKVDFSKTQIAALSLITITVLAYNYVFKHFFESKKNLSSKFTPLHFYLIQIVTDLIALSIIVYFMGGIESPLFMFFVFHMIIGSFLLPDKLMYFIASGLVALFTTFSVLEYFDIIKHQSLRGFYATPLYNDPFYMISFLLIFAVMIFTSVYLTSKISKELYNREGQLKLALDTINEAEKAKQKYVMAVVHELKSPIAAAVSQLALAKEGYVDPNISAPVKEKIEKANIRLQGAIENINNILRVSKFKLMNQINKSEQNLSTLLLKIIEDLKEISERKNIHFKFKVNGSQPIINGDDVLLNLAFSNLIGNAVKYTPENGVVEIIISEDIYYFNVEITDDGIGIPKQDQENIFDEFFRASNAKNSNIEGTGTGLSVVKQIFENHDGEITVESPSRLKKENRNGTTFLIKFKK